MSSKATALELGLRKLRKRQMRKEVAANLINGNDDFAVVLCAISRIAVFSDTVSAL